MEKIKTYKAVLLGVLGLAVVVGGAYWYTNGKTAPKEAAIVKTDMVTLEGQVVRMFEGENKVMYSLNVPASATSTAQMEGALIKVVDGDAPYVSMYFSYEGGRGYMPVEYIENVIVPRVSVLTIMGTTTIGSYEWTVAESPASEWYVAQVGDGQWLVMVESKKDLHDKVVETLKSLKTQ